jgi:hypothetical protein
MMSALVVIILLNSTMPIDLNVSDAAPIAFPQLMPQAANDIVHAIQDLAGQDDDWRAGARAWLGNDSLNSTGLFYA